ncbi:hypothetical protein SAMN04487898_11034 [Pedobacter sp. ok626]|nr:hypothetical protein SAMN04487898_11034 [Pedobacter sp. ok626]
MGIIGYCTKYKEKSSLEKLFFVYFNRYSKKKDTVTKYSERITQTTNKEAVSSFD